MSNSSDSNSSSTQSSRIIRVRDLPVSYDRKTDDIYRYVPKLNDEQPKMTKNTNWLYLYVSQTRQSFQQIWNENKALRKRISRGIETGQAHTQTTIDYIRDDETLFPKVAVVTVAGLGGLLLGHKGGLLRKTFCSTVAATVALSACYPKQSAQFFDQVYQRIQNESKVLFDQTATTEPVVVESKDRILHTNKLASEPVLTVNGDQQFYTTRAVPSSVTSDSEKKV